VWKASPSHRCFPPPHRSLKPKPPIHTPHLRYPTIHPLPTKIRRIRSGPPRMRPAHSSRIAPRFKATIRSKSTTPGICSSLPRPVMPKCCGAYVRFSTPGCARSETAADGVAGAPGLGVLVEGTPAGEGHCNVCLEG
jgi:hypothetical protein